MSVHLSLRRLHLSLARPLVVFRSSVFLERISRIKSKNTCKLCVKKKKQKENSVSKILCVKYICVESVD